MSRWTPEEDALLRQHFMQHTRKECAALIGRSESSVHNRCMILRLKKGFNTGQFKAGAAPRNKGKKQVEYMTPEAIALTAKTRFMPGHNPHNHKPVGSTRIDSKDGYLLIKVAEPKDWQHYHRVVWQEANGPIPKGCNVQFKDGNKMNFALENLYMIDKKGNMLQNSIVNLPPQLKEIVILKKRINLKLKKYGTEQD